MIDDDIEHLTRSLGFLLADTSRRYRRRLDQRAHALGLTTAQWRVLGQLRRREGINQSKLAEIMEIENITLGRHIDRLEDKGWVERRRDPADRRAWCLYLDNSVRPLMDQLKEFSHATSDEAMAGLTDGQRQILIDCLLTVKGNLDELERSEAESLDDLPLAAVAGGKGD